jgi:16S rRNA (cytidine1402-2'-O)-methyltransferase
VKGTLYLVPTPLDFGMDPAPLDVALPAHTLAQTARLTHWITENAKSTRAFLKRVGESHPLAAPLQAQQIVELPREVHKKGDHGPGGFDARPLLAPALQGHDVGLVSEAGMPAIADPGASVVRAAHELGLRVLPLVGPISLMLALAASGLNGQHFAFVGYLPQDAAERTARVRELEAVSLKSGQTQIFIETPYRNEALLKALLQGLHPHTRLAVMVNATLPSAAVHSALVSQWKKSPPVLPLSGPAVFLFGR